jgi:hypothetical protein
MLKAGRSSNVPKLLVVVAVPRNEQKDRRFARSLIPADGVVPISDEVPEQRGLHEIALERLVELGYGVADSRASSSSDRCTRGRSYRRRKPAPAGTKLEG